MKKAVKIIVPLAALAAGAAHLAFWYSPRARAVVPDRDDIPARILVSADFDSVVWLAFPHQNLGELEQALVRHEGWLGAASRLAGAPRLELPSFGPFSVPPARELAAGFDGDGELQVVAARIYPGLARLSRLAGKVAGNPWLGGGEVEVSGGAAKVAWDGSLWTLARDDVSLPEPGSGSRPGTAPDFMLGSELAVSGSSLARIHLQRSRGALAAGRYRVEVRTGGLELVSERSDGVPWEPPEALEALAEAVAKGGAVAAVVGTGSRSLAKATGVLLLFDDSPGESRPGPLRLDLPGAAVLSPAGEAGGRLELPGEKLPRFLSGRVRTTEVGRWVVRALDEASLEAATALAPELTEPWTNLAGGRGASRGASTSGAILWLDPAGVLDLIDRGARVLEEIPLAPRAEALRWRDWHTVLAPLTEYGDLFLLAVDPGAGSPAERAGLRLRMEP